MQLLKNIGDKEGVYEVNWLKKNYWRIVLAVAVGTIAYIAAQPASAALQPSNAPLPAFDACAQRISSLDPTNLVTEIKVEENRAFDLIQIYLVEIEAGIWRYVTVTAKNGCIIGIGA